MNQKLKTTGTAIALSFVLGIYACSNEAPQPSPTTPAPSVSTIVSEAPTPTPEPTTPKPVTEEPATREPKPTPSPSATSSGAGTPAIEFASRWGKRYPEVPEFAILKSANTTCRLIEKAGPEWNNDELLKSSVGTTLELAGMQYNDAVEFAQDAEQNYCSSVSNPT